MAQPFTDPYIVTVDPAGDVIRVSAAPHGYIVEAVKLRGLVTEPARIELLGALYFASVLMAPENAPIPFQVKNGAIVPERGDDRARSIITDNAAKIEYLAKDKMERAFREWRESNPEAWAQLRDDRLAFLVCASVNAGAV